MKKILLVFTFIVSGVTIMNAQVEKGNFLIGASSSGVGFTSVKQDVGYGRMEGLKQFIAAFKGGYFFKEDLMLGLQVPFQVAEGIDDDDEKFKHKLFIIAPTVRAYFIGVKSISAYFELSYGIGKESVIGSYNDDFKADLQKGTADVGLSIFISKKISLDLQLGYLSIKKESDKKNLGSLKTKGFQSSIGLSIFL